MAANCSCAEWHTRLDDLLDLLGSLQRTLAEVEREETSFVSENYTLLEEALTLERVAQEEAHEKLREVARKKAKADRARNARRALRGARVLLEATEKAAAGVPVSSTNKENEKRI